MSAVSPFSDQRRADVGSCAGARRMLKGRSTVGIIGLLVVIILVILLLRLL